MKFFKKVKENLKDPKKKSLTLLGIYGIFFLIVFLLLKSADSINTDYDTVKKTDNEDILETIEALKYDYTVIINNNDSITEVIGSSINNIDYFNYNGFDYKKENGDTYLNGEIVELDFDIDKYKYKTLELLIENSDSETKYRESNDVVYNMTAFKYFNITNNIDYCENQDCSNYISITIGKDKYINKAIIDLSSYYGYTYNVEIYYRNFESK